MEKSHILRGLPLEVPLSVLLVVSPDTEQVVVSLLYDVLRAVPEDELLVEAVSLVVPPGRLLLTASEDLGVLLTAVRVTAAVDVTGGDCEVAAAEASLVLVLALLTGLFSPCDGGARGYGGSGGGGGGGSGGC